MEMPLDVLTAHLSAEHAKITTSWATPTEPSELATAINDELHRKFIMIPIEEVDAIEVGFAKSWLRAGSGPEEETCGVESSPNWLFNRALNALALSRYLRKRDDGEVVPKGNPWAERPPVKHEVVPWAVTPPPEGATDISVRLTGNPMLWYMGTDRIAYRLDEMVPGDYCPLRERQIAMSLIDLSANALREQTL